MSIELLKEASAAGVNLFLSHGKLKVRANKGALSDELRQRILDEKDQIVALLTELDGMRSEDESDSIKPALRRDGRLPLSYQQQRLWVLDELQPGGTGYNMPFAYRIRGDWSLDIAQAALDGVLARHEVLRTSFHRDDEEVYQLIHDDARATIARYDLNGLPVSERDPAVVSYIEADGRIPFDLEKAPLIRVAWIALSPDEGVLYFNLHHLVFDGWSIDILLRDFIAIYKGLVTGGASSLMPLPIQYADYASWQRRRLNGDRVADHRAYWSRALDGAAAVHSLPLDNERPRTKRQEGGAVRGSVPAATLARLREVAESFDITLFMLLHGALSIVLARYGADSDVVIGTPVANRDNSQLDDLIGFFINTLVLRVDCSESQTVGDYFRSVREANLAAQTHQDIPFEMLLETLDVPRSMAHSPLFQVMLSLDNNVRTASSQGLLDVRPFSVAATQAKYDLTLHAASGSDGMAFTWVYDLALFDENTIVRLDAHLACVLEALPGNANRLLGELESLRPAERGILESGMVGPSADVDPSLMPDIKVAEVARRVPDTVALVTESEAMSYAELDRRVNHLAALLQARGVGSQDRVGVFMASSPAMVVAVLATLRAGAVYVPLDAAASQAHVDHVAADSGMTLLLSTSDLPDRTRGNDLSACYLDEVFAGDAWRHAGDVETDARDMDGLAYILYTSGSTGRPKGVAVTRRGLCNYLGHCLHAYAQEGFVEAVMSSPLTFDATVTSLFTPLVCGRRLRVVQASQEGLARALGELLLDDEMPRLFKLTPAHLDMLSAYWVEQGEQRHSTARSVVVVGGEQLLKKTLEPFLARFTPSTAFVNEYGPTETVVGCCTHTVRSIEDMQGGSAVVPIGLPIRNTSLHVLQGNRLAPLGAPGELFIGGAGVARGYLNQPDLQERHFVARELSGQRHRLYRTGDMVRQMPEGRLVFLGRNDEQIKLRGYRIEPAEIQTRLCEFAGVREACVLLSEQLASPALVAYVVVDDPSGNDDAVAAQLREWCKSRFAAHMVPSVFRFVSALPVTANGKIDKKALLALPLHVQAVSSYVAPETPVQAVLCDVFASLLKQARVGINDNFFSLGGDSILAIQAVSRARKAGVGISTQLIVEHQTVAELSRHATDAGARVAGVHAESGEFSLTPIQHWFVAAQPEAFDYYNQSLLLEGPVDLSATVLADVVAALLSRHDMLRATFERSSDEWRAWLHPYDERQAKEALRTEVLPDGVEAGRAFIAERCRHYQASLNLARGPLFRVVLFQGGGRTRVLILAHHMVVDGVSWRIVLEDFERAYAQLSQGRSLVPGAKGTSYRYWSELLEREAGADVTVAERAYWLEQASAPDFGRAEHPVAVPPLVSSGRQITLELPADQTEAMLTHANTAYATQTQDILLAAVYLGLAPWAGTDAFRIELEGHGRESLRDDLDLSETVGWFTCMYPHVLRGDRNDLAETLRIVKEDMRAIPRGGIGYGLSAFLRGGEASLLGHGTPRLLFNYLGQLDRGGAEVSAFGLANEDAGPQIAGHARRSHRLGLTAFVAGGRMRLTLDYSEAEYEAETARHMLESIMTAADTLVGHCARQHRVWHTPSDFPLATLGRDSLDRLQANEDIEDIYPSTPTQEGMLASIDVDPTAYVTQFYPLLRGVLDTDALGEAWQAVTDRYAVLRTRFAVMEGRQYQIVRPRIESRIEVVDLSGYDASDRDAHFSALLQEERLKGFTSDQDAFYRLTLVCLDATTHRLLFTCHHCIFDGWSMPLVVNRLLDNVMRLAEGQAIERIVEPDYRDYVAWLQRQDVAGAEDFWRAYLDGSPPSTGLRLAVPPRHDLPSHGLVTGLIDVERTRTIREFARSQGVSLNTLMQFAWAITLGAYSGSRDVTIGAVVSGRPPELENIDRMVGVFINTIPVRVRLDGEDVRSQLSDLQKAFHEADRNGFLAYSEIKRAVAIDTPLFGAVLDFKNYPMEEAPAAGDPTALTLEDTEAHGTTSFDIVAAVGVYDRIMFNCTYRRDRYEARYMSQLIAHVADVLAALAGGAAVRDIHLGAEAWRDDTRIDVLPAGEIVPMHRRFERVAAERPGDAALSCGGTTVTFGDLNRRANRIAHLLRDRGVTAAEPVGLMLGRGIGFVTGMLGILKAGGAYVPVDPSYPADRKAWIVEDAGLGHVLCEETSRMDGLDAVCQHAIDEDAPMAAYQDSDLPDMPSGSASLAYVLYTSGSTGKPKGVMVGHEALSNLADGMRSLDLCGTGTWALVAPFVFDASLQGLCHLMEGGHLVVLTEDERIDAALLVPRLAAHDVDIVDCTPTLLESWIEQGVEDALPTLVVGGEGLPDALWRRLASRKRDGHRQFNAYGPTECTVNTSVAVIDGDHPHIGHCLPCVNAIVLDADLRPCPPGVAGELYIGGRGLAQGYLGKPELTEERFLRVPGVSGPNVLYRTGDAARRLPDGRFECLGRLDEQVKINGNRVELGEVAAALDEHRSVDSALVLTCDTEQGRTQLVACVRPAEGVDTEALSTQLAAWLRKRLPEYMRPHRYIVVDAWPMTGNGKVDREKLLSLQDGHVVAPAADKPANPKEALLAELFARTLGRDEVGLDDNFYELGGDSILAIRLVASASKVGIKIAIKELVAYPTVRSLAEVCGSRVDGSVQAAATGTQRLMPIHHEVMADRWHAGADVFEHFNGGSLFGLAEELSERQFMDIHAALLDKHDALRLAFDIQGPGEASARYLPSDDPAVRASARVEHVSADESDIPAAVRAICQTHQESFRLAKGGLLKLVLIRATDVDRLLVLAHHAIADVVSWHVLIADIGEAVSQCLRGEAVTLQQKTSSYQAWGNYLAECAATGRFAAETAFWATQLATDGLASMPTAENIPAQMGHRRYQPVVLGAEDTAALLQASRSSLKADIDTVLLTALYRGLTRWRNAGGFRFLMETHGRHSDGTAFDLSQTVGWFTQSYPLRLDFAPSSPQEDIAAVAAGRAAVPNKGIGYGVLRFLERSPALAALPDSAEPFQILFNYLGQFSSMVKDAGPLEFRREDIGDSTHARLPLTASMAFQGGVYGGQLSMNIEYDDRHFDVEQTRELAACIGDELATIAGLSRTTPSETIHSETI